MNHMPVFRWIGLAALALYAALPPATAGQSASPSPSTSGFEVLANGLANPRGFAWGPDGELDLALAGSGGLTKVGSTPFRGGDSSSIVTVSDGCPTAIADGFPSTYWQGREWVWGVMDVAWLDGELYALHSGGQQGWGLPETPNGIYRVGTDGNRKLVADLAGWFKEHLPRNPPDDFDRNGSLFDMESDGDRLWITESNGGRLLTVTPDGEITLIADLSAEEHSPTGLALDGEGGAYVAYLTIAPFKEGTSKIVHVDADGTVTDAWTGLTAVNDIALGPDGALYAAEMATSNTEDAPFLTPNSGRIVRQAGLDQSEPVATDIPYPVMIGFDDDGMLYVSGPAFGPDRNERGGWLARTHTGNKPISFAGIADAPPTCRGVAVQKSP